ncbi:MAG: tetratricopeptide repeat protein [Candidatus Wallbacteria bacterium]|nr:tetratricopeptide repeat protein [Candidatus Wallbacteria bacterium]
MIPSIPAGFCGRQVELQQLLNAFPLRKLLTIAGIGGIGKTALALAFAHKLEERPECTGRVVWISCRNGWGNKDFQAEIVHGVVELTGNKKYSSSFARSPLLLVSMLEENSIILFIDNFHLVESEETRDLLRTAKDYLKSSKIILITRKRPSLSPLEAVELYELRLAGLSREDSAKMASGLLRTAKFESLPSDTKIRILEKVNGHPFSLKLFLGLLTVGEHTPESLLSSSEFEQEKDRNLLDQLWISLSMDEQEFLKSICFIRIPVRMERLPGFSDKTRSLVKRLLDNFLVESDAEGRIFLHNLLREYTQRKIDQKDMILIHKKIAVSFSMDQAEIQELREAYFHFLEAGDSRKAVDALILLSRQLQVLGEDTGNFYHLLCEALNFSDCYRHQELVSSRIEFLIFHRAFSEADELLSEIKGQKDFNYLSGLKYYYSGHHQQSIESLEIALKDDLSTEQRLYTFSTIASAYNRLGKIPKAEQYFQLALKEGGKGIFPVLHASAMSTYAVFLAHRGQVQEALEYYQKAETIERGCHALVNLSTTLYNKALLLYHLNEIDQSAACLSESRNLCLKINDQMGLIYIYYLYGELYHFREDFENSLKFFQLGLELALKKGLLHEQGFLRRELGNLHSRMGQFKEAEFHYQSGLKIYQTVDSSVERTRTQQGYGQYLLLSGRSGEAREFFEKAVEFGKISDNPQILARSYYFLYLQSRLASGSGADDFYRQYLIQMEKLPVTAQDKLQKEFKWYEEKLITSSPEGDFTLLVRGREIQTATASEIRELESKSGEYEIFVDFSGRRFSIQGSEVPVFKKKVLVPLLLEFLRQPGRVIKSQEIFETVWGRKYNPESDGGALRKTISRLREMLGDNKRERFICSASEKGCYFFNPQVNYCIIIPQARN